MSVTNITRLQVRRGNKADLPQLSSAELGWAIDSQKLYIGNGDLSEGAPEVGNTEVLTQHSDLHDLHTYILTGGLSGPLVDFSFAVAVTHYQEIRYSLTRDTDTRCGQLRLAASSTGVNMFEDFNFTGSDCGLAFSAALNNISQIVTISYALTGGSSATLKMTQTVF